MPEDTVDKALYAVLARHGTAQQLGTALGRLQIAEAMVTKGEAAPLAPFASALVDHLMGQPTGPHLLASLMRAPELVSRLLPHLPPLLDQPNINLMGPALPFLALTKPLATIIGAARSVALMNGNMGVMAMISARVPKALMLAAARTDVAGYFNLTGAMYRDRTKPILSPAFNEAALSYAELISIRHHMTEAGRADCLMTPNFTTLNHYLHINRATFTALAGHSERFCGGTISSTTKAYAPMPAMAYAKPENNQVVLAWRPVSGPVKVWEVLQEPPTLATLTAGHAMPPKTLLNSLYALTHQLLAAQNPIVHGSAATALIRTRSLAAELST